MGTGQPVGTSQYGLQGRRRAFYLMIFAVLMLALAGSATGMILLDDSWLQLLLAGGLGLIFTQFAFLGHEASHRQIFESGRANDRRGRVLASLVVGISYSWWMNKHSRHHANPTRSARIPTSRPTLCRFWKRTLRRGRAHWRGLPDARAPSSSRCCCSKGPTCTSSRSGA